MENYNLYLIGFLGTAALFLLYAIYDGVQQGMGRKLMSNTGLILGILVALSIGDGPGKLLHEIIPYPLFIRQYIGAIIVGFMIFGLIHVLSILLIKKTKDREGSERTTQARGGALIGSITGALSIAICVLIISMAGKLASIALANTPATSPNSDTTSPEFERRAQATAMLVHLNNLDAAIANLPGYLLINSIELIPAKFYRTFDKSLQVSNDPHAADRFMRQPRVRLFLQDPLLQELTKDQELNELAERRDLHGILSHSKVRAVCEAPEIQEWVQDFELEKALDAALNHKAIDNNNALIPNDAPYQTVPFVID